MEGIRIERRSLLALPALAAARPWGGGGQDGVAQAGAEWEPLFFEELTRRWGALANEFLPRDLRADEVYVGRLRALLARLATDSLPEPLRRNGSGELVAGPLWGGGALFVVQFELAPGAVIPAHDHPPMVVATAGVEGTCHFTHYEWQGERPSIDSTETHRVRESRGGVLEPGRVTALTRARDGLHTFRAGPEGARIVDFGCTTEPGNDWTYVGVEPRAVDAERRVHEAVRLGKEWPR